MKNILFILFNIIYSVSFCQNVPQEDYIYSKRIIANTLGTNNNANLDGDGFIYFNDSCVLLHVKKLSKNPLYFKIYKKVWDEVQKNVLIVCYDSVSLNNIKAKNNSNTDPVLSVTLDYNTSYTLQQGHTKSITNKFIQTSLFFYKKGFRIDFGIDAISQKNKIKGLKEKYNRLL